jgi:hypothetical protein
MIKQLRRRHFQIWLVLLILIPAGIISATIVIPGPATNSLLQPTTSFALPNIIKTINKENYAVNLRSNTQVPSQIEWINKTVLTIPTAVIYKIVAGKKDVESGDLIGRIESKGTYHFYLREDSTNYYHFVLYDFIHKQIIDSINFTP